MPKKFRYRYSSEHLDFEKIPQSIRMVATRVLFFITMIVLITIFYYIVFSSFFDTPAERGLKRENQILDEQYQSLSDKFESVQTVIEELGERDKSIHRSIFQADPVSSAEYTDYSGTNRYEELSRYSNSSLVKESKDKLGRIYLRGKQQSRLLDELLLSLETANRDSLLRIPAIQPVHNPGLTKTGATTGMRMHPFYKITKMHDGMDFIAAEGTTVFATAKGIVAEVGNSPRDYGKRIIIDHGNGYRTIYSHLDDILVKKGAEVTRGSLIGYVGNTGASVAPHLHYTILKNKNVVEPINFFFLDLSPDDYAEIIHLASNNGQSLD